MTAQMTTQLITPDDKQDEWQPRWQHQTTSLDDNPDDNIRNNTVYNPEDNPKWQPTKHRYLVLYRQHTPIYKIFFHSGRDASYPEICFMIHSHNSWPRSGDCERSRIRTRDCCVLSLVSPSCLSQLSYHIPTFIRLWSLLRHHLGKMLHGIDDSWYTVLNCTVLPLDYIYYLYG
jgi:hypothetical protein